VSLSHSSTWAEQGVTEPGLPFDPSTRLAGKLTNCWDEGGEASALLAALRRHGDLERIGHGVTRPLDRPRLRLDDAYRACVSITRRHSRSFFLSTQLLPVEKRRALRALYAFCRTSDDLVDQPGRDAIRDLAAWVSLVHAPHPPPDNAVLLAWNDTAERYIVPRSLSDELLAGVAMDLTVSRYATFDDLWLYCYRVAAVVGLISIRVIGACAGAERYAVKLGVALQLTNILRDIGEDARRGRVYLPQEDLARFGLCDRDILTGQRDERFRALMRFEIGRANALYAEAWPGIALLSADSRLAVGAAAEIYRGILARIIANDYDVFTRRAYLSLAEKLLMLPRVWLRLRADDRRFAATSPELVEGSAEGLARRPTLRGHPLQRCNSGPATDE
jgi:phytoene synthase